MPDWFSPCEGKVRYAVHILSLRVRLRDKERLGLADKTAVHRSKSPQRRGLSLTSQLFVVLVVGAVLLSLVATGIGAEQAHQRAVAEHHERMHQLGARLASRAAPLLERGDELRLAVLAAAAADLGKCRVFVIDKEGRVRLDTGLGLGGQDLGIMTADGAVQHEVEDGAWEMLAPALGNGGFVGEVRLRYRPVSEAQTSFSWSLFGAVFLSTLSLIALACWLAHTWVQKVRVASLQVKRLAAGDRLEPAEPRATGALHELQEAMRCLVESNEVHAHETEEAFLRMAKQVVHSLEQRELVPSGHGGRTRRYALLMANKLDIDDHERRDLSEAALLLDIGKSCVRPSALVKSGRLDEIERESLRQHPVRGAHLLTGLPSLSGVALAIRHQQERYDGAGFPDGRRGPRIPLSSRILAISSAYDLLTCRRPGAGPMSWPDALDRLHEDRGELFDPELLDSFEQEIRLNAAPRPADDRIVISANGVLPYRAVHEHCVEEEWQIEQEEQDAILAFGEMEIELLPEEEEEDAN